MTETNIKLETKSQTKGSTQGNNSQTLATETSFGAGKDIVDKDYYFKISWIWSKQDWNMDYLDMAPSYGGVRIQNFPFYNPEL